MIFHVLHNSIVYSFDISIECGVSVRWIVHSVENAEREKTNYNLTQLVAKQFHFCFHHDTNSSSIAS